MKYLKRFNEELDPKTYRRAGYELSGKFKEKRASELLDYADEKEFGFYNMHFANANSIIGKGTTKFTKPTAKFYYEAINQPSNPNSGEIIILNKSPEDLIRSWKDGGDLAFTISFTFQPSQGGKRVHKELQKSRVPMFSIRVELSDWYDGLESWNEDQDTGESLIGTPNEHDTYDMFVNSFNPRLTLEQPAEDKWFFGIFSDRKSALKFKRELPKMIEPFEGHILDIISALGADSEHYEKIMENLGKISINSLYDEEAESYIPKSRWFNGNRMT